MSANSKRLLTGLALVSLLGACRSDSKSGLSLGDITRQQLGPGVELLQLHLRRGDEPGGRAHLIYADPKRIQLAIELNQKRLPLSELASDALLTMNGAFFTPSYTATGLLVSGGRQLNPFVKEAGGAGSGVFVLGDDDLELLNRDAVGNRDLSGSRMAIQAGPRVIEPGGGPGIRKDDGARAHRSFIGRSEDGRLVLGVVLGPSGWNSGPSLYELQGLLVQATLASARLAFALNLDGGPSTGMYLRHPEHRVTEPESAAVYSYLVLRPSP